MKNMKKFILLFVVLFALLSSAVIAANAQDGTSNLEFTIEPSGSVVDSATTESTEGEIFTADVLVTKNDGFLTATLYVNYDPSKISLLSINSDDSVFPIDVLTIQKEGEGRYKFKVDDYDNVRASEPVEYMQTGKIVTLEFQVIGGIEDTKTEITIKGTK